MHFRVLSQGAVQALLAKLGDGCCCCPGERQHVDALTDGNFGVQANQLLGHQIAALLVISHQATDQIRKAGADVAKYVDLIRGEGIVDGEQLDAAALGQTKNFRGGVQFIDEHQVIGPVGALQRFARLDQRFIGIPLRVAYLQRHAQVVGRRRHEL